MNISNPRGAERRSTESSLQGSEWAADSRDLKTRGKARGSDTSSRTQMSLYRVFGMRRRG